MEERLGLIEAIDEGYACLYTIPTKYYYEDWSTPRRHRQYILTWKACERIDISDIETLFEQGFHFSPNTEEAWKQMNSSK